MASRPQFWSYEDSYMQFQAGTLDRGSGESDVAMLKRLAAHPSYRVVWKMARDGMSGAYRDYVDSLMLDIPDDASFKFGDLLRSYLAEEFAPEGAR